MKISNFESKNGNKVPNQFIIHTSEFTLFQSYNSIIIKTTFEDGKRVVYLDEFYWDYSKTTGKYRNQFLGEDKKTTESKIKNNIYKLANLN
jgi:hypothetical protein